MLETVLTHLNNWFPAKDGRHAGTFTIASGVLEADFIRPGQYYRVKGSVFNDGLHRAAVPPSTSDDRLSEDESDAHEAETQRDTLTDEVFTGEVWALAVPRMVIELADDIAAWQEKNPETDKVSESFGGYSYTRSAVATASGSSLSGWQAAFAGRLAPYRRSCDD